MRHYQRCKLTIEVPTSYDQRAIRKALVDQLPGVEIVVHVGSALRTTQAFVPDKHPLDGMAKKVGRDPAVRTGGRTLQEMSDEVLGRFKSNGR